MVVDGGATGTVQNRDQMPRVLSARSRWTPVVHVVEHIGTGSRSRGRPDIEGRSAEMALPPEMQPDAACRPGDDVGDRHRQRCPIGRTGRRRAVAEPGS